MVTRSETASPPQQKLKASQITVMCGVSQWPIGQRLSMKNPGSVCSWNQSPGPTSYKDSTESQTIITNIWASCDCLTLISIRNLCAPHGRELGRIQSWIELCQSKALIWLANTSQYKLETSALSATVWLELQWQYGNLGHPNWTMHSDSPEKKQSWLTLLKLQ